MTNVTPEPTDSLAPALARARALIALLFQMLGDPSRSADFHRLCEEAENLLLRCMFEGACRLAGRTDLLATHEPYLAGKGRSFDIRVRLKPDALHPHHRIILNHWRAIRIAKYRRALARRSNFSRKLSYLHFRNQRRRHARIIARRRAGCATPSHTPARISAPP